MPGPNYEKRRPPQDPMDGKGANRYSQKVQSATDSVKTDDVEDFGRGDSSVKSAINPVSVIANFSRLGEDLKRTGTFMEVAKQIAGIAEMAEATVMQETDDWFDGHTVKRNMSELKKHAGAFVKLAQEMDMMQQRSTALYDDMGNVLSRYFEMAPIQDAMPTGDIGGGQAQGIHGALRGDEEDDQYGGEKAPEFDGPGGNPEDDEGRRKHDAQDGVLDDDGYAGGKPRIGFDFNGDDEDDEVDELVESIVDSVMERILPDKTMENETMIHEKGEETEFRARKALRTPKSFARPHQHMSHDQALEVLRRLGVKNVDEAREVFSRISEMMQEMTTEGYPKKHKGRRKWGSKKRQTAKKRKKARTKRK